MPSSNRSFVTVIPSDPKKPKAWKPEHLGIPNTDSIVGSSSRDPRKVRNGQEQGQSAPSNNEDKPSSFLKRNRERRDLSNDELHMALQRDSECVNYKHVQETVEFLIGERGELPAKEHYQALIAVQANLKYGSAMEVERLLQEMHDSDIELDAGICSTVLRECSSFSVPVSRLIVLGSCNSSTLFATLLYYQRDGKFLDHT